MAGTLAISSNYLVRILACCVMLAAVAVFPAYSFDREDESNLVRVNIVTKVRGDKDTVEINGKLLTDYRPIIIQAFTSTGLVIDGKGHVMTFLGYRWLDIQNADLTIEVSDSRGQRWKGKLVGIDQSNGVAVIKLTGSKLKKTPVCTDCEVKDGITVIAPVPEGPEIERFAQAQVLSVGTGANGSGGGGWLVTTNRPFPDIGQPILTTDHRVLGFIANQDPMGIQNIVYPIDQLLESAEEIIDEEGDIRTGWLGIFLLDADQPKQSGVLVERVEDESPAQRAGLAPRDFLLKFDGHKIKNSRQFIHMVQNTPVGSKVELELVRNGIPMTVTAPVEARRPQSYWGKLSFNVPGTFGSPVAAKVMEQQPRNTRMLVGVDTILLTPPLAEALHMPGQSGLLVIDLAKGLPAETAGVLIGDVIVSMDGQPIEDALGFASYLMQRTWGTQVVLKVMRKGVERTITLQLNHQNSQF